MKLRVISAVAIASSLALLGTSAFGEDKNKGENESWSAPQNDSQYWGKATKTIGSDSDQQQLDAQSPTVPGLKVVSARVFEAKSAGSNNAALVPLGNGNLINRGGATLPSVNLYAIFWGPASTLNSTYQTNTTTFLSGLNCSGATCTGLTNTIKQYVGGATLGINFANSTSAAPTVFVDTSNPPTSAPSTTSIANEVVKVVVTNAKKALDPKGLYLVFTSNYPSRAGYCAWHSAGSAKVGTVTTKFTFGYMPNLASALSGCGAHFLPNYATSGLGEAFDSLFNVTTHELYETMSDPMTTGYGWYDAAGYENGDKCSWYWSTPLVISGRTYYVQQEYSNATSSCAAS